MKYFSLILTICMCSILLSGCIKMKAAVVDMTKALPFQQEITEPQKVSVQGRTIKLGGEVNDDFGPSFDFDKLQ